MKMFAVRFRGYWPIGAVAVVQAEDTADAVEKLRTSIEFEDQRNHEGNSFEDLARGCHEITDEIDILLDGNY